MGQTKIPLCTDVGTTRGHRKVRVVAVVVVVFVAAIVKVGAVATFL